MTQKRTLTMTMHEQIPNPPDRRQSVRPWLSFAHAGPRPLPTTPPPPVRPGERLAGRRIIVVEDEALLAMDMQFALEDEGADVIGPALSLEQALDAVSRNAEIDGAILDVDLAGHEVYPVASILIDRGVPIVFHTGHGSPTRLAEMFPGSVTFSKPTLPETLILALLRISR